jgi:hypothetical protein
MKKVVAAIFILSLSLLVLAGAPAGEKGKEVKLTGKICCPKCELAESKVCGTVIVVTKDKKDINYYFDAESNKKYHDEICSAAKKGTVEGTVTVKDKKNIISVKKVTFE